MEEIIVHGGYKLQGTVKIEGGKNAALPILAATILAEGVTTLTNVPIISDIFVMNKILRSLNIDVEFNEETNEITVNADNITDYDVNYDIMREMRASILILGSLLARKGYAKVALPGGCTIGKRPIDLHFKGFEALGAKVYQNNGFIEVFAEELIGNTVHLHFPSVGATQNIILAAVKAKGDTVIDNAAKEPEIVELANFLNKMGAKVIGAGTKVIKIKGVNKLTGVHFDIIQDRHEAGTFMIAAAMTEGDVLIENAKFKHNSILISKLRDMGTVIRKEEDGVRVIGAKVFNGTDIKTEPYPGFPTDLQAPISAMLTKAKGTSVLKETVYENRFQQITEMERMGAVIEVFGDTVVINGGNLRGAAVAASDLRSAAALVLAGLSAKGITRVSNLEYLDRGYCNFHLKLQKLGARLERVTIL